MKDKFIVPEEVEIMPNGKKHIFPRGFHPDSPHAISWQGFHIPKKGVFVVETHSPEECFYPEEQRNKIIEAKKNAENTLIDGSLVPKKKIEELLGRKLSKGEDELEALRKL